MTYTYLFDNNLYRILTTSANGEALKNFNNSLYQDPFIKDIASGNVSLRMTAFTIIEALGITIPHPSIVLSSNLLKEDNGFKLFSFLKMEAKTFYRKRAMLKKQHFLNKAKEQSKYTTPEAAAFEKQSIFDPLPAQGFEDYIVDCLAYDYICKYDFPKKNLITVLHGILIPSFFIQNNLTSGLSKFRLAKKIWDMTYSELLTKSDHPKEDIEKINKSMRLKKHKDFLDCEIIHMVCTGDYFQNSYQPVVAFTCDDSQTIINRIKAYKLIIKVFTNHLNNEVLQICTDFIKSWQQGVVVICNIDGTFKEVIKVSEIPFLA